MSESFVKTLKHDYAPLTVLPDTETILAKLPGWIEDYCEVDEHWGLSIPTGVYPPLCLTSPARCPVKRGALHRGSDHFSGVVIAVKKLKARGRQGSWFAEVKGQWLPCVHKHWIAWPLYSDPGIKPGTQKEDEYIAALKQGTVILTSSEIVSKEPLQFRRTGYIAIWTIKDVVAGPQGITFQFVSKENELE
jgi:hypothetical protein